MLRMNMIRSWQAITLCIACLSIAGTSLAQTARSGGGAANAQLMQQLQQLASERTRLQADNASMKKELDDVRKERDALKTAQKASDLKTKGSATALAQSSARREQAEQELKQTKDKMTELVAKFRETLQTLREIESERTAFKQSLATRDQDLKTCKDRSLALYKLNGEVLTKLENDSFWSRAGRAEPFTRIKRVQLENLIDDYKDRANDALNAPPKGPPSASQPTSTPQPTPPR
jgi:chromosome segregation ATPase